MSLMSEMHGAIATVRDLMERIILPYFDPKLKALEDRIAKLEGKANQSEDSDSKPKGE
jgi:hypothetical protein